MSYFRQFPQLNYDFDRNGIQQKVVDIYRAARPLDAYLDDLNAYSFYQIKNGEKYYKRILQDKDAMKLTKLDCAEQAELIGRLFIEEDLLDSQQMSCVKSEMKKSSYDYGTDDDNAWTFYNHVTHALKKTHPRDWVNSQQNFHDFITVELIGSPATKTMFEKPTEYVDMGQIDVEVDIQEQIVMDF
jgi:hypothetical protein